MFFAWLHFIQNILFGMTSNSREFESLVGIDNNANWSYFPLSIADINATRVPGELRVSK